MWYLGIDPGRSGAGVALAPDLVVEAAWWWTSRPDGSLIVRSAQVLDERVEVVKHEAATPHALGVRMCRSMDLLGADEGWTVACEGAFVGPRLRSGLALAQWTGEVLGPLRRRGEPLHQPVAIVWRRVVLGLPARTRSEDAKRLTEERLPGVVSGFGALLDGVRAAGVRPSQHLYDAAGVAWWLGTGSRG